MANPTLLYAYRTPGIQQYFTVPAYSDLLTSDSATPAVHVGDIVRVLSTNIEYRCVGDRDFVPVSEPDTATSMPTKFRGWKTNFADTVGKAVADTAATVTLVGSGLRIHGQGVAETDSGVTVAAAAAGPIASLLTTDEAAHTLAISFGSNTEAWDPATYGPMVVEAEVAMSTALTARAFFLGWIGADADALDPVVTGSTITLTLVQDDVSGLFYDSGLTAASRLYAAHNKADEAATILTTDSGVDTSTDFSAAGTYMRLAVRIEANGTMKCYINGTLVSTILASASTSVALNPVLYVESNTTAIATMLCKSFAAYSLA